MVSAERPRHITWPLHCQQNIKPGDAKDKTLVALLGQASVVTVGVAWLDRQLRAHGRRPPQPQWRRHSQPRSRLLGPVTYRLHRCAVFKLQRWRLRKTVRR